MKPATPLPWKHYRDDGSHGSITTLDGTTQVAQTSIVGALSMSSRSTIQARIDNTEFIVAASNIHPELLRLAQATLEWIDAVPLDLPLPSMPGFDRDWANQVIAYAEGKTDELPL